MKNVTLTRDSRWGKKGAEVQFSEYMAARVVKDGFAEYVPEADGKPLPIGNKSVSKRDRDAKKTEPAA